MSFKYCVLIFVVESDPVAKTDELYIKKFLQVHYNDLYNLTIKPVFIYAGSKFNYNSPKVQSNIKTTIACIPKNSSLIKVIYCFDRDRIHKDKRQVDKIQKVIFEKKCEFVLFSKNIEDCFAPKGCGGKVETAKNYYKVASKLNMPIFVFDKNINVCKTSNRASNLNIVIKEILSKLK